MASVFLWGLNADGQCGCGQPSPSTASPCLRVPHRAKLPSFCEPRFVSLGNHFSVVLCADGSVLTAGKDSSARLGRTVAPPGASGPKAAHASGNGKATNANASTAFGRVSLPLPATCVSAGSTHAAAVLEDGSVHAWGKLYDITGAIVEWDRPRMLFPAGTCAAVANPHFLPEHAVLAGERRTIVLPPPDVDGLFAVGPQGKVTLGIEGRVVAADLGPTHAAAVTLDGRMWTWPVTGVAHKPDADSELGWPKGAQRSKETPRVVTVVPLEAHPIVSCAVTRGTHHRHTSCVSADGTVWSWGSGYKGKLAWKPGDDSDSASARPAVGVSDASRVLAGGIHAGLVDKGGLLKVWGCGSDGRLGFPESEGTRYLFRVDEPRAIEFPDHSGRVIGASLGYYHSAAVIERKQGSTDIPA